MNQHLLVIFVYVHQRYNTYLYVETDFLMCIIDQGKNISLFVFFFLNSVSLSMRTLRLYIKVTTALQRGPRKVKSGKHVAGRSEAIINSV